MTQPLALVVYEKLLPGTQLVNKLQDLGYRVQTVSEPLELVRLAERDGPLLVFADLESTRSNVLEVISRLRANPATQHLPVVAFGPENKEGLQEAARSSGVTLFASEATLIDQLAALLQQALLI